MSRSSDLAARDKDLLEGTPPRGDGDQSFATTEFVMKQSGNYSKVVAVGAASYTMTVDNVGGLLTPSVSTAQTYTLPKASTCLVTDLLTISASAGGATINAASGDSIIIFAGTTQAQLILQPSTTAVFCRGGGDAWVLIGGDAYLPYAAVMKGPNWVTKAMFDSSKSLATTEFVQRAAGTYSNTLPISTSQALVAADIGKAVYFWGNTAGQTVTAPDLTGLPLGASIKLFNISSQSLTLNSFVGTQTFTTGGNITLAVTTYVIPAGTELTLVSLGGNQWLAVGTATMRASTEFATLLAGTGYMKLPGGLIVQWGQLSGNATANTLLSVTANYNIAFPTQTLSLAANIQNGSVSSLDTVVGSIKSLSTTQCTMQVKSTVTQIVSCNYIAVGY